MNAATTARATNQSAAIALLAAASAKPAAQSPRDDSFAQTLSSVNESTSKGEGGLFAARQEAAAAKPNANAANDAAASAPAAKPGQPGDAEATSNSPQTPAPTGNTESKSAAKGKASEGASFQEPDVAQTPAEAPLVPVHAALAAARSPASNVERKPATLERGHAATPSSAASTTPAPAAEATTDVAATSASATNEADEALNPVATATKRAPTDPLRLIPPNDPAAAARETATKPIDAAPVNTDIPVATRQPRNDSGDNRNTNMPAPQAFGLAQPGKTVPQSPVAGTATPNGSTIGNTATSNTSTSMVGAPRVETGVVPPRLPGGRTPEAPVSLKLTARPLPTGEATTTQTEADAAATQIARGLGAAFRNKGGQLTLWMNPESLGKLRVQMTIENGTISARFEATSDATKNLLSQNVDALRSALESRGLSASSIEIVSVPDWSKQHDQPGTPGSKQDSNGTPFQQRGTNQDTSGQQFSHNGSPRDNMPPKLNWLREPEVIPSTPTNATEQMPTINVNERLLSMTTRLEIDAVA